MLRRLSTLRYIRTLRRLCTASISRTDCPLKFLRHGSTIIFSIQRFTKSRQRHFTIGFQIPFFEPGVKSPGHQTRARMTDFVCSLGMVRTLMKCGHGRRRFPIPRPITFQTTTASDREVRDKKNDSSEKNDSQLQG